MAGWNPS